MRLLAADIVVVIVSRRCRLFSWPGLRKLHLSEYYGRFSVQMGRHAPFGAPFAFARSERIHVCTSCIRWLRWPCSAHSSLVACMHVLHCIGQDAQKPIFKSQQNRAVMMHSGCRSAVSLYDQFSRPFCIGERSDWCLHKMYRPHDVRRAPSSSYFRSFV